MKSDSLGLSCNFREVEFPGIELEFSRSQFPGFDLEFLWTQPKDFDFKFATIFTHHYYKGKPSPRVQGFFDLLSKEFSFSSYSPPTFFYVRNYLNFTVVTLKMRKDAYFFRNREKTRESPQLYRGHTKNVQGCL